MPKCLGIYIEDDVIKYAKVDKTKDVLKVDASSVVFYEKENLFQVIEKIIRETFSSKDSIAINISNELYNYFEVFSALKLSDKKKSVDLDFELLCSEKGYNKDSLDSRFIFRDSRENTDKLKLWANPNIGIENIKSAILCAVSERPSNSDPIISATGMSAGTSSMLPAPSFNVEAASAYPRDFISESAARVFSRCSANSFSLPIPTLEGRAKLEVWRIMSIHFETPVSTFELIFALYRFSII